MNTKEKIEIMQAFEDGKDIEYKDPNYGWKITRNPVWNFLAYEYRIKKAPKYRQFYLDTGDSYCEAVEIKALEDALYMIDQVDYLELDPRWYQKLEELKELVK